MWKLQNNYYTSNTTYVDGPPHAELTFDKYLNMNNAGTSFLTSVPSDNALGQSTPRKRTSTSRRYINLASILSQSAFKSRLCLFCFCDFASSSHSLSCVASLLVVSLRHLQVEVCDFFFCLFVKGLDWLRDCVANGIIGGELRFNLKLGIYIFFL